MELRKTPAGRAQTTAKNQSGNFELPPIPDDLHIPQAFQHPTPPKQSLWHRLKLWIATHKKLSIVIAAVVVLILAASSAAFMALRPKQAINPPPAAPKKIEPTPPPTPKFYSPLTGLPVPDEATAKRQVTAVMIENSPSARPQSGLLTAGVVYEAIAEGGITRLAVLYQESRPGLVGPVRSLRPYYLSWMAPYDAAISHVGGSYNALNEVRVPGKYKDIDQFFNGRYYWRATDRYAPHNVYTSFDKIDEMNKSKGFVNSSFTGLPRKTETPATAPNATSIDIRVSSATYSVHYDYEKASNSYLRTLGGQPSNDREGGRVKPKVVIAMKVNTTIGWEDGYREQMTVNGASGEAFIFEDGIVEPAKWTKGEQKEQLHFRNPEGNDIKINPGQTWITVIPTEQSVLWQ